MTVDEIDQSALATLRPDMPVSKLQMLCGDCWDRVKPNENGLVSGLVDLGFSAEIDTNGMIGSTFFSGRFPVSHRIEQLHIGMPFDEVVKIYPGLRHIADERPSNFTLRRFGLTLQDGIELEVRLRDDRVLAVQFLRPGLVYGAAPPKYPPPAGSPGAPFADPNFKLVVLDALRTANAIDLGSEEQLAKHFLGPRYDRERDGHDLLQPVYDYLVHYPLTPSHLSAVEELVFDGGSKIYFYVRPLWDAESDELNVTSLDGIAQLTNLRSINVISMLDDCDLSRLANLKKLQILDLHPARYQNAETLLSLPALKALTCFESSLPDRQIAAALEAKGVKVKVY
jgi:hypothetical protein